MCLFVFNDTETTEIYTYGHTLSLHDALPIYAVDGVAAGREGIGGNAGLTLAVVSCRAAANRPGETSPMWQSTAMIAAAASAGLLAVVLAYLAAADRTCPAWRLWSASFAMDAARSLALVGHPGHR